MAENLELFHQPQRTGAPHSRPLTGRPLADRLRPSDWKDFQGLEQLDARLLRQLQSGQGRPPSLILWGPPGCGKTTIARLIGNSFDCHFVEFSAVLGGVKEVREIVDQARRIPKQTLLFVDEIHRFNKAQQDAFLPHVESGLIVLIGATTENPSFYLTQALLSRARVIPFAAISEDRQEKILDRALEHFGCSVEEKGKALLYQFAAGDARKLLNMLETFLEAKHGEKTGIIGFEELRDFLQNSQALYYDRSGDQHYNIISAFIKSMRGSDADAALYYAFRMLEAGEDPRFVIRRMIIFAAEDIGNADPRALMLATSTLDAFQAIGLPEGKIPIAQCVTYLACAPKSNRSYMGMHKAIAAVQQFPRAEVPLHLRNAPTSLMKNLGYGAEYQYPHDFADANPDQRYLPDELKQAVFYEPGERGYEARFRPSPEKSPESEELASPKRPAKAQSSKKTEQ